MTSMMDISDDDDDLQKAIALSLQDHNSISATPENTSTMDNNLALEGVTRTTKDSRVKLEHVIDVDEDVYDTKDEESPSLTAKVSPRPNPNAASPMLGLDRKAMEQERLARKRKMSISPPPTRKSAKVQNPPSATPAPKSLAWSMAEDPMGLNGSGGHIESQKGFSSAKLQFPTGAVKKTWALGHIRDGSEIKIEEVLQSHDLTLAVLSSFQWDSEWVLRKVDMRKTRIVYVMQAKDDSTKQRFEQETADMPNLRLCFPPMEGQVTCMHSKLMLLSHPTYLRIVVPSANLVPYDWGETGVMENSLFLIDLPRYPEGENIPREMTAFGLDLVQFLNAMGLDSKIIQSLYKFSFSATSRYAFVHSIGGSHKDKEVWRTTGYCGLGRAIQTLNLQNENDLRIDYVTSSVGSLNHNFIQALYLAAQGDDGMTEYVRRNAAQSKSNAKKTARETAYLIQQRVNILLKKNFRIYFPTLDTVASSIGGTDNGGTICFSSKYYSSPDFPSKLMRDCKSTRRGLLMHNKVCKIAIPCPFTQRYDGSFMSFCLLNLQRLFAISCNSRPQAMAFARI